jgi:flagellar hook-basal body complex protein FliE
MPIDALAPIPPLPQLSLLAPQQPAEGQGDIKSGFAALLNNLLDGHRQANAAADAAVQELATGQAQDLHRVSLAIAQADVSFRLILETRNRLSDALQEVTRMQV